MKSWISVVTLVATLAVAACASSSSRVQGLTYHLGRGTEQQILDVVPATLHRFGYSLANTRLTPSTMFFETSWSPSPSAQEPGALDAASTRITVEARRVGKLYSVWLRVENGVPREARWRAVPPSRPLEEQIAKIATAIKDEIDAGVRVY